MPENDQRARKTKRRVVRWGWIGIAAGWLILWIAAASIVIARREPILRQRVIETLSTRFQSRVELDTFHVSLLQGLQVSGEGLGIFGATDPNHNEPGTQPIISVAEFRFHTGIANLFRSPMHVDTVYLKGLVLNLPPREHRGEMTKIAPPGGKIEITVDRLICDRAQLTINTLRPGKLPIQFDIENLTMTRLGYDGPMHFDANLTNPKPVGNVLSSGSFGPWQPDSPRETPVSGTYFFNRADLSTIKGIGGILSSNGHYAGILDRIVVDGATDTPDFRIAVSGREVPLHTDFHAIVDGTSGDTYLQPVKARILNSWLTANGSVVRAPDGKGHRVQLDAQIAKGKIEDLLRLGVRTDPPIMTGSVRLKTHFELPPGDPDVANRLTLNGNFEVSEAHFSNEKLQHKVDVLSLRSQGKPKLARGNIPGDIPSDLNGTFHLTDGVISFPRLQFQVPGTRVNLMGTYSLDGNQFDFHGKALLDAKLSHTVTGWKSLLLKPADPFFSKDGAGTEIPVKVTGTKSEPHFGSDFHRKNNNNKDREKGKGTNGNQEENKSAQNYPGN